MSDSKDTWPEPNYSAGKREDLHAIGIIAMNYNAYERSLFQLYHFHLGRKKVPKKLAALYYFALPEDKRIAAISSVFEEYERNKMVRAAVKSNLAFFDCCAGNRNHILHAERYPRTMFGSIDDDALHLVKRKGKRSADLGYLTLTLSELRSVADAIRDGHVHCLKICLYLRQRGLPLHKWSPTMTGHGRQALPGTLPLPIALKLRDDATDPTP